MMQQLRNPYVMKYGMYIVLGITIPSFVLFYGFSSVSDQTRVGPEPEVTVETSSGNVKLGSRDLLIARDDAARYYVNIVSTSMGQPVPDSAVQQVAQNLPNKDIADFAVATVAFRQRLEEKEIRVTETQVSEFLREQGITRDQLNNILKQSGESEARFAQRVRRNIEDSMAEQSVSRIARTSLLELWLEYVYLRDKVTMSYAAVPVAVDQDTTVSAEALQKKYDELVAAKDQSIIERERRVYKYVALETNPVVAEVATETELVAAYESAPADDPELRQEGGIQVSQILRSFGPGAETEARTAIEAAKARLAAGEDFGKVADSMSNDWRNLEFKDEFTSATLRGGKLPYLLSGTEIDAWGAPYLEFVNTAEPGKVSELIETPQGYALLKVDERREAGRMGFSSAREIIQGRVRATKTAEAQKATDAKVQELYLKLKDAYESESTIEGVARALNTTVRETSPTLSTQSFIPGVGNFSKEREALRVLDRNEISPVLRADGNKVAVFEVIEILPEGIRKLDEVRPRVESLVRSDLAAAAAEARANGILAGLKPGDNLTSVGLQMNLRAVTLAPFERTSPPDELQQVIGIQPFLNTAQPGATKVLRSGSPQYVTEVYAVRVDGIASPSREDFMKNIQQVERDLNRAKRQGYVEEFRRESVKTLKAKFNDAFKIEEESEKEKPAS